MIRYSSDVTIDRPPSAVFDALVDPARYAEWTPMTEFSLDEAGPPRLGTRGRFRMGDGPIKGMLDMEVIEFEPGRRMVVRVTHPALTWIAMSSVDPRGTGSLVTYAGQLSLHGWRRILEPFLGAEVRKGEAKEIGRFKELIEQRWLPVATD